MPAPLTVDEPRAPMLLAQPDGSELGLRVNRFDERQRRLRLRLPKAASCWDYAPLIDVVRLERGFEIPRFTGRTAAQWLAGLRSTRAPDYERARQWYESVVGRVMDTLARRPRIPVNHYCIELAVPPFQSSLPGLIRELGLRRASVDQWLATLKALTRKGVKAEELEASGVLVRLRQLPADAVPTVAKVLRMVDLRHVIPRLATESRFGFVATSGWRPCCKRISAREYRRRGLIGKGPDALHLIRFRHRALGWSIVRTRYRDLLTERMDWWSVLNEHGRFVQQPVYGFDSPEDAMEFAELRMSRHFASWGQDQVLSKWEEYSLPGGDGYREILLQLDDWLGSYHSRHYRTRNVLAHIRTSIRTTQNGRRVLFLDEIQSDWHADLHAETNPHSSRRRETPPPTAPFRKEWPLLSLKLMLWWAQRLGMQGLAWSTAELQLARWQGYGPPEALYRTALPGAAKALSTSLGIASERTRLSIRANSRRVELGETAWQVCNREGVPITKPFRTRAQAESFADRTGRFVIIDVPVLWITDLPMIRTIPLYGVSTAQTWHAKATDPELTSTSAAVADQRQKKGARAAIIK